MYIPYQGQQATHRDIVNDGLRRAEQRRMLAEHRTEQPNKTRMVPLERARIGSPIRRVAFTLRARTDVLRRGLTRV